MQPSPLADLLHDYLSGIDAWVFHPERPGSQWEDTLATGEHDRRFLSLDLAALRQLAREQTGV